MYFAKGKENVNVHRLKEPDKTKYEIYKSLKENIPISKSWSELEHQLKKEGIEIHYKFRGKTNVVQGVSFEKNKLKFNGSKVDRQFSYSKIDYQLKKNMQEYLQQSTSNNQLLPDSREVARIGAHVLKPRYDEQKENGVPKLKPQKKRRRGYRM